MSTTGRRLRESSDEILRYISQLREQRNELGFLVEKQKAEKATLEAELARVSYKLNLIKKSLSQRVHALQLYDATLREIEIKYKGIADTTQGLLTHVRLESTTLESSIDKRIGTDNGCKNCPRCDSRTAQNENQEICEIPTKQPFEGDKKQAKPEIIIIRKQSSDPDIDETVQSMKIQPSQKTENNVVESNDPLYTRTMEYPMVLSPMMQKARFESGGKLPSDTVEVHQESHLRRSIVEGVDPATNEPLSIVETTSESEMVRIEEPSTEDKDFIKEVVIVEEYNGEVTEENEVVDVEESDQEAKIVEEFDQHVKRERSTSGNFRDGDYSDSIPSPKGSPEHSSTKQEIAKDGSDSQENVAEHLPVSSEPTAASDSDEDTTDAIKQFDEVIVEVGSGSPGEHSGNPEECNKKEGESIRSNSVEVFAAGYLNQHNDNEPPPSIARYKRSIFNKRENYLFTEE